MFTILILSPAASMLQWQSRTAMKEPAEPAKSKILTTGPCTEKSAATWAR